MIWDASMGVQSPKSKNLPKSCLLLTYHLGYFDNIFGILTMTTYDETMIQWVNHQVSSSTDLIKTEIPKSSTVKSTQVKTEIGRTSVT